MKVLRSSPSSSSFSLLHFPFDWRAASTHTVCSEEFSLSSTSLFFFSPFCLIFICRSGHVHLRGVKGKRKKGAVRSTRSHCLPRVIEPRKGFKKESTPFLFLFRDVQKLKGDDQVHAVMSNFCYCWKMHQEPAADVKRATAGRRKESL